MVRGVGQGKKLSMKITTITICNLQFQIKNPKRIEDQSKDNHEDCSTTRQKQNTKITTTTIM